MAFTGSTAAATTTKHSKKHQPQTKVSPLATILFFIVLFAIPILFLLHTTSSPSPTICKFPSSGNHPWSGDLREASFAWNRLQFAEIRTTHLPISLKVAVFSRKWPTTAAPGGMERHAHTLHTALAQRGHRVHVFTSPPFDAPYTAAPPSTPAPLVHYHDGDPGRWIYSKAWQQFEEENLREPFDVVHSESVALPYWMARRLPNLAVSWHGIALESLQSTIYQDLARLPDQNAPPSNTTGIIPKLLSEIRFFKNYRHHVAISDSCGEMLRDIYQIPDKRVHVILNGVDEFDFVRDPELGQRFRSKIGIPGNASVVFGVAGRLVKDKGHPILHAAFSKLVETNSDAYLIVAGSGPWEWRYKELGFRVKVLGPMNPVQLREFYNVIDVFVNPTLRPQGLDLTLMEAMMVGKPLMASRFPSIKGSILVDDEFGFMFAPNVESLTEALEAALNEGAERLAQRGEACRKYAATMFTAQKMALAYERLFLCIRNESFCAYGSYQ